MKLPRHKIFIPIQNLITSLFKFLFFPIQKKNILTNIDYDLTFVGNWDETREKTIDDISSKYLGRKRLDKKN